MRQPKDPSGVVDNIESERQYRGALQALEHRRRPAKVLRTLMNALERYRQARKLGWSRPQNKHGLTIFHSFVTFPDRDRELLQRVFQTARETFTEMSESDAAFLDTLSDDAGLMAFVFVHDAWLEGRRFEGVTFSCGRRAPGRPRFRDRFDLILESEVVDGVSQGLGRLRCYVDPFDVDVPKAQGRHWLREPVVRGPAKDLFECAVELYPAWAEDPQRVWSHWTSDYIDYFGPRQQHVEGSFFPTPVLRLACG